ncbi:hypothetical protein PHMEG_00020400 [Phytophthora megakarya]|uniref:Uncharacterized protein n=1 Tax=Phytophthora megakarya TaxID=4795 RepID=A0A225VP73_9STRA|nr:hypothetical protein PHMEG_00020400 [Phytophthora megakarya]
MEVVTFAANNRKVEQRTNLEQRRTIQLYEKMTFKQKVILGLLCAVIALEGLYLMALVIQYIAEWFILLLAVTRRLKRLRTRHY